MLISLLVRFGNMRFVDGRVLLIEPEYRYCQLVRMEEDK